MDNFILPTDRMFIDSPDPGPHCICSRCGEPIIDDIPIRIVQRVLINEAFGNYQIYWQYDYEYRFHAKCIGITFVDTIDPDEFEIE